MLIKCQEDSKIGLKGIQLYAYSEPHLNEVPPKSLTVIIKHKILC